MSAVTRLSSTFSRSEEGQRRGVGGWGGLGVEPTASLKFRFLHHPQCDFTWRHILYLPQLIIASPKDTYCLPFEFLIEKIMNDFLASINSFLKNVYVFFCTSFLHLHAMPKLTFSTCQSRCGAGLIKPLCNKAVRKIPFISRLCMTYCVTTPSSNPPATTKLDVHIIRLSFWGFLTHIQCQPPWPKWYSQLGNIRETLGQQRWCKFLTHFCKHVLCIYWRRCTMMHWEIITLCGMA